METAPSFEQVCKRIVILRKTASAIRTIPSHEMIEGWKKEVPPDKIEQFLAQAAIGARNFWLPLREGEAADELTVNELEILDKGVGELNNRDYTNLFWRQEPAKALLWAIGLEPELAPIGTPIPDSFLDPSPVDDYQFLVSEGWMRLFEKLEQAREVAELWHWCGRTVLTAKGKAPDLIRNHLAEFLKREIIDEAQAAEMIALPTRPRPQFGLTMSQSMERHRAFNWLCGLAPDNDWDRASTDT